MSVLHGHMVVSKEEETGIMYRGEFYPPIDLALEAYDYLVDGSVETALGILDDLRLYRRRLPPRRRETYKLYSL